MFFNCDMWVSRLRPLPNSSIVSYLSTILKIIRQNIIIKKLLRFFLPLLRKPKKRTSQTVRCVVHTNCLLKKATLSNFLLTVFTAPFSTDHAGCSTRIQPPACLLPGRKSLSARLPLSAFSAVRLFLFPGKSTESDVPLSSDAV